MEDSNSKNENILSTMSENEDLELINEVEEEQNKRSSPDLVAKTRKEDQILLPPEKPPGQITRTVHLPVPENPDVVELIEHEEALFKKKVLPKPLNIFKVDYKIKKIVKRATKNENSAIIQAFKNGHYNMITPLAFSGHDINTTDEKGRSPLYLSILRGQSQLTMELLHLKADMAISDKEGRAPLHVAALVNNRRVASILIKEGAAVDSQDEQLITPLMIASQKGALATIYALMLGKADPTLKDAKGKTAIDYANDNNYSMIAKVLEKRTRIPINEEAKLDVPIYENAKRNVDSLSAAFSMERIGLSPDGSKTSLKTISDHKDNDEAMGPHKKDESETEEASTPFSTNIEDFLAQKRVELKNIMNSIQKLGQHTEESPNDEMTLTFESRKTELKIQLDKVKKEIDQACHSL